MDDEDEDMDRSLFISALTLSSSLPSFDTVSAMTTSFAVTGLDGDAALVEDLDGDADEGAGCGFGDVVVLGAASDGLTTGGCGAGVLL